MNRVHAFTLLSLLLATGIAPSIANACPMSGAADGGACSGGSLLTYVIALGVGILAGVGSMGPSRRV